MRISPPITKSMISLQVPVEFSEGASVEAYSARAAGSAALGLLKHRENALREMPHLCDEVRMQANDRELEVEP